jgi:transposase
VDRGLKKFTRAREGLVKVRTQLLNKIHRDLSSSHIKVFIGDHRYLRDVRDDAHHEGTAKGSIH